MKPVLYKEILKTIKNHKGLTRICAQKLVETYSSIEPNTLYSILSQEISQKESRSHGKLFKSNINYYEIYKEAKNKGEPIGVILNKAIQLNTSPALLAKKVLEQWSKSDGRNISKKEVTDMLRDTTLIDDGVLAYEIFLCVINDDQYGAISTSISDSIGEEYEIKLQEYLTQSNIPFYDERHLRSTGHDKTPDFKLEEPIYVNGIIVTWIESKAQFGSREVHQKYTKEQLHSYWNRFGTGIVIYWFGFLDTIIDPDEKRFIVMDHYPENIVKMKPEILKEEDILI